MNRQPGRWQYKTSPKPRVTIRKQNGSGGGDAENDGVIAVTPTYETAALHEDQQNENGAANGQVHISTSSSSSSSSSNGENRNEDGDLESSGSVNGDVLNDDETIDNIIENKKFPIETLKVEISTPADFKDTYYEIATIKSPYTYQVSPSTDAILR